MSEINIKGYIEPDHECAQGKARYSFTLYNEAGQQFDFIVDLPKDSTAPDNTVDVWLNGGYEVMVGDTPADGFATYTPKDSLIENQGRGDLARA